jgi:hypothetical protein
MVRRGYCFLILLLLAGCSGIEVRYDAAPSPIDSNRHTVLLEIIQNDVSRLGFGQIGVSYADNEVPNGDLLVHTPLPGSISIYSNRCGIQTKEYHPENGGSFRYSLNKLFAHVPEYIRSCVVNIFVSWELPNGWVSEYKLEGMSGRLYYRRRNADMQAPKIEWIPQFKNVGETHGVAYGQFREYLTLSEFMSGGEFYLTGCGHDLKKTFTGSEVTFKREEVLGVETTMGECVLFGWVKGTMPTGNEMYWDIMIGASVYDSKAVLLSGNIRANEDEICYDAESAVTGCILNYNETNEISNKLSYCFDRPENTNPRLGCWTHKGRAVYGIINNNNVEYVH